MNKSRNPKGGPRLLTPQQHVQLIREYRSGKTQVYLSATYGFAQSTISRYISRAPHV